MNAPVENRCWYSCGHTKDVPYAGTAQPQAERADKEQPSLRVSCTESQWRVANAAGPLPGVLQG